MMISGPGRGLPAGSPVGSFGQKFRTERERRGFTLDDVSNVTKINARMLKAIEDEHFDLLPGGVFNKGFVRAYAKHLGFNDEESISEYLVALRQAQVQAQTAVWQTDAASPLRAAPTPPSPPAPPIAVQQILVQQPQSDQLHAVKVGIEPTPASSPRTTQTVPDAVKPHPKEEVKKEIKTELKAAARPNAAPNLFAQKAREPERVAPQKYPPADLNLGQIAPRAESIPWKVPAVVLVVILVSAVMWNRHSRAVKAEDPGSPRAHALRAPAANTAPVNTASAAVTAGAPASNPASNSAAPPNVRAAVDSAGNTAAALRDHDSTLNNPVTAAGPDAKSRKLTAAPVTKAPPVFSLRIRASETTWIAVIADGQPLVQETLIAPAATSIRATREITVKVGNAAGISFLLNGKEIPPQGAEAEVKTLTFDSHGMKEPSRAAGPDAAR